MAATIPLWDRMTAAEVDKVSTLISSGVVTVEDAFLSVYPVSNAAIWRALAAGREISARQEDGGKGLTEKERRGAEFYRKIQQAQARGRMWLQRAALGVEVVGGKVVRNVKTESPNAMKILLLNSPSLRTPWRDPDELAAIAAHAAAERGDVERATETPAQTRARLTAEAATLGLRLAAPPTEAERQMELRAYAEANGMRLVPADALDPDDGYDPATATATP